MVTSSNIFPTKQRKFHATRLSPLYSSKVFLAMGRSMNPCTKARSFRWTRRISRLSVGAAKSRWTFARCIPAPNPNARLTRRPFGFLTNFLGSSEDTGTIADAIEKVLANIEELRGLDHKAIQNQKLGRADRES